MSTTNARVILIGSIAGLACAPFIPPTVGIPLTVGSCLTGAIGLWLVLRSGAATAPQSAAAADSGVHVPEREVLERVGNGRFELLRLINGDSEQGDVFEAYDTQRKQAVAVQKLPVSLSADASLIARITPAIQAVAPLAHPAILPTLDVVQDAKNTFIVTGPVTGEILEARITRDGRFSPRTAIPIGRRIAEGLAFAHAQKIFHGDINPLNVLLDADSQAKITGFGLAGLQARQLPGGGTVTGSPTYTSPEQAQGKPADARSDVYSFGIMLYHMLTGRPPFEGDAGDVLARHVTDRVPTLPDVPADLDTLLHKCTHPEPARRYQDGAALVTAFRRLQGEIA